MVQITDHTTIVLVKQDFTNLIIHFLDPLAEVKMP